MGFSVARVACPCGESGESPPGHRRRRSRSTHVVRRPATLWTRRTIAVWLTVRCRLTVSPRRTSTPAAHARGVLSMRHPHLRLRRSPAGSLQAVAYAGWTAARRYSWRWGDLVRPQAHCLRVCSGRSTGSMPWPGGRNPVMQFHFCQQACGDDRSSWREAASKHQRAEHYRFDRLRLQQDTLRAACSFSCPCTL